MPSKLPLTDQLFYRSRWKQNWLSIDVGDVLEFTMDELFDEGELEMMDPLGVEFKNYNPKTHQDMLQHKRSSLAASARYAKPHLRVRTALRRVGHDGRIAYEETSPEDMRMYVWYEEYTPVELDGKEVK